MGWNNPWFYTWNSSSSSLSDAQEQQAIHADKGLLPYQILSQNVCACGCVLVPNYVWLGEQVISYFRWLLLLCPIEERGGRCWRRHRVKRSWKAGVSVIICASWKQNCDCPGDKPLHKVYFICAWVQSQGEQRSCAEVSQLWAVSPKHHCSHAPQPLPISGNLHFPLGRSQPS